MIKRWKKVYTEEINKIALSSNDDRKVLREKTYPEKTWKWNEKRPIQPDNIGPQDVPRTSPFNVPLQRPQDVP